MLIPERQKREARPTGALLFLWLLFLLPIGSCGGMGTFKLLQTRRPVMHVSDPVLLQAGHDTSVGDYVTASLHVTLLAKDEFPIGKDRVALAKGYYAYAVKGAPEVLVISSGALTGDLRALELEGQLCDDDAKLVCELPERELSIYVRSEQELRKKRLRVLLAHARPGDQLWEAATGYGVVGFLIVFGVVGSVMIVRAARRPGRLGLSHAVTLRHGAEHVRSKIRAEAGPLWRIAHDAEDRMTVLVGKPAGKTRLTGAHEPEDVPLRIDLELGAADAYRGTTGTVEVRMLLGRPPAIAAALVPSQVAMERAAARMTALCESA
jgi:hypothetical protein